MTNSVVNLQEKLSLLDEQWSPRIVAQLNDYFFKIVEVHGGDRTVHLKAMEMFVVPRGVEHKPFASAPCRLMLIEPGGTSNTGDAGGDRTAPEDRWI